jgi:glutamate--cysteine ligase
MTTRTESAKADPPIESRDDLLAPSSRARSRRALADRHRAREVRLPPRRPPRAELRRARRHPRPADGADRVRLEAGRGGGNVIACRPDGTVSLEPAGQLELSGAPLEHLHQTCAEAGRHLKQVKAVGDKLGLGFLGLGMWPDKRRAELPVMPKGRYAIMLRHMPRVGSLGLDMMLRTCTIQVNLDYSSEADMAKKFRVGLALQPLATALFANSPFTEGKPNGFLSFRSHIWSDTDPHRTGMLPFVFEDGFGYERYSTMRSMCRCTSSTATAATSTRRPVLPRLPRRRAPRPARREAALSDWTDHLSTAFPEVRLKSFLEMRGADGGRWSRICALPALWVGLLYDQGALDAAWDEVKHWTSKSASACATTCRSSASTPGAGRRTLRDLGAHPRHRRSRASTPAPPQRAGDNEAASSIRCARSSPRRDPGRAAARALPRRLAGRRQPHLRRDELRSAEGAVRLQPRRDRRLSRSL